MAAFQTKKVKILSQLSKPDEVYEDASPKGSVDQPIRDLVSKINSTDSLVTTSSCSGRIAIYFEGVKHPARAVIEPPSAVGRLADRDGEEVNIKHGMQLKASQGKGGGCWLFVSHNSVPSNHRDVEAGLAHLLSSPSNEISSGHEEVIVTDVTSSMPAGARLLHFKFEPLILHVLCANLEAARRLLEEASGAGFRESGAASLPQLPTYSTSQPPPESTEQSAEDTEAPRPYPRREKKSQKLVDESVMVAIRTMGLGMDAPIGYMDEQRGCLVLTVGDAYLQSLLTMGNERFIANEERKGRLSDGIGRAFGQ